MARQSAIPTLAAALKSFRDWQTDAKLPSASGDGETEYAVDYRPVFIYFDPAGVEREVVEEQLESKGAPGGMPFPGRYEIRVLDSNGDVLVTWEAEHVTMDSLARRRTDDGGLMAAVETLSHSFESQIRNTQHRLEKAERNEETAKEKQRIAEVRLSKAQAEIAAANLAKERALADRDMAEARQKELQEAYTELEDSMALYKPHLRLMVDHGVNRLGEMLFGIPPKNDAEVGEEPQADWDKPPENLGDPAVLSDELLEMLFDMDRCQPLVENGFISWKTVRDIMWHRKKIDPGPVPKWAEWRAERDAADAESQAAE